jgi:hypothetical protein
MYPWTHIGVWFAGIYPDNNIPLGPVVQVRRDDSYRVLGKSLNDKTLQLAWHCAYYITKDMPKVPSAPTPYSKGPVDFHLEAPTGSPDEAPPADNGTGPAPERQDGAEITEYDDKMMDASVANDVATVPGAEPYWRLSVRIHYRAIGSRYARSARSF